MDVLIDIAAPQTSMELLSSRFGWQQLQLPDVNTGGVADELSISAAAYEKLRQLNLHDLQLYAYMQQLATRQRSRSSVATAVTLAATAPESAAAETLAAAAPESAAAARWRHHFFGDSLVLAVR